MYYMILKFNCDATLKSLDQFLFELGEKERPVIKDAFTVRLKQTISFIPNKETLREYEKIIKNMQNDRYTIVDVRFDGYEVFEEV